MLRRLSFELVHALRAHDQLPRLTREFRRHERCSPAELQALQRLRLAALLQHAAAQVPYYRELLGAQPIGDRPEDIEAVLRRLPPLAKQTIRARPESFVAAALPLARRMANDTGGSTGSVLRFYVDANSRDARAAATHRFWAWCGVHPTDRQAMLWGAAFDAPTARGWRERARQALHPLLFLSSFRLDDATLKQYLASLESFRPQLLTAYPSPLLALCAAMPPGYRIPSLRAVLCSAEQLFPAQRARIEASFGLPVFDRYGSREFGNLAQECEVHDGLHVAADRVLLEIVDDEGRPCGANQPGEILITDFDNFVQPFVRYRTGDLARWLEGPCPCGRTLPRIGGIEGRSFDLVQTAAGRRIAGTFWTLLLRRVSPRITEFQIVQDGPDHVTVRLRTSDAQPLDATELEFLWSHVRREAPDLRGSIDMQSPFDQTRAGKHRVVVNRWRANDVADPATRASDPR